MSAFCNTFDLHYAIISLENRVLVFLSVAVLHKFCSMFCCTLLNAHSIIAMILMGKRELVALLNLSSWCLVMVERFFLAVPRGCLQFVIVVFPDHTHYFLLYKTQEWYFCFKCKMTMRSAYKSLHRSLIYIAKGTWFFGILISKIPWVKHAVGTKWDHLFEMLLLSTTSAVFW